MRADGDLRPGSASRPTAEDELRAVFEELEGRLRRYPSDRYPVQHATAQFHLGIVRSRLGDIHGARDALVTATRLFDPAALPVEHARALNGLGAVLRLLGDLEGAAASFERAADLFGRPGHEVDRGTALHNLGLVARDAGDAPLAARLFGSAVELFRGRSAPHEAASARELGAALFETAELERAREVLERAVEAAERSGDEAGVGAASNTLGLVHLSAGRLDEAVRCLRRAVAGHPRSARPADHAMARANLALAWQAAGDRERARLDALQAEAVAEAPPPVRAQARAVLDAVGRDPGALVAVLHREPRDGWPPILRAELTRWTEASDERRRRELEALVNGLGARDATASDLAESLLAALLELPPEAMERLVEGLLGACGTCDEESRDRVRSRLRRAMAAFHPPQMLRLESTFGRLADGAGAGGWW